MGTFDWTIALSEIPVTFPSLSHSNNKEEGGGETVSYIKTCDSGTGIKEAIIAVVLLIELYCRLSAHKPDIDITIHLYTNYAQNNVKSKAFWEHDTKQSLQELS